MAHAPLTLEERINAMAKHCEKEEFILTFGYDPQSEKWFCNICEMRTEDQELEFTDTDLDSVLGAMEAHLEM